MENISRRAITAGAAAGMAVTSTINDLDGDSEDDDSDFEPNEETMLETYGTPLDEESCPIDEYNVFKEVMTSKRIY